jgi:hypothetical protein
MRSANEPWAPQCSLISQLTLQYRKSANNEITVNWLAAAGGNLSINAFADDFNAW